jgi:quinolinate synthase
MTTAPSPTIDLRYSPALAREMYPLYERVKRVMPEAEWAGHAPYVKAINELKRQKNAVILAHNYQAPEIYHGVSDVVGDSLYLAKQAALTEADVIVQGGKTPEPAQNHFDARYAGGMFAGGVNYR